MAMKDQEVVIEAKKTDGCILEVVLPQIIAGSTHTVVYLFSSRSTALTRLLDLTNYACALAKRQGANAWLKWEGRLGRTWTDQPLLNLTRLTPLDNHQAYCFILLHSECYLRRTWDIACLQVILCSACFFQGLARGSLQRPLDLKTQQTAGK